MALIIKDRVKEITTTTGTGAVSLGGSSATFDAFQSVMSNGDTTFYAIVHTASGTDEWEVGVGTWNTGNTLTRTTVYAGSNGTSAVNFSSGNKDIFMTYPASKAAVAGEDVTFADVTATDITATGTVTLSGDPTSALQAATKEYVDTIAAAGIHYHTPVRVESPSNLNATYDNGSSGVGATLTNAGTQAALVIDGITLSTSDRVLVYNQTNAAHNGIYTVTNTGSASTNWVLTRATDADSYGIGDPDAFGEGDAFFVKEGNTGAGELYVHNTSGTITFGTTNITFTVIAETAIYSAGTGLTLTGTTFSTNQDISTSASPTFNNITVTGTVDGRDVATDGSKLDGIESGATADQSAAEIKTAYESNSNTNAFTDAEQTKLSGIETGATGDQTASEILTAIKTVDGAGSNLDADLLDGQQGSYYLNTSTTFSGDVSGTYGAMVVADDSHNHIISNVDGLQTALDGKTTTSRTITAGDGLTGGGNFTANRTINVGAGSGITVTADAVSHADTSSQASVNNSNGTVIQDVTLDTYGHVTGLTSANLDGRYYTETEADSRFVNVTGDTMTGTLTLTGSSGASRLRIEGTTPTMDFDDSDGDSFYIHVNSNNFYVLTDRDGGGDYNTWESPHPLQLEADTNIGYLFGNRMFAENYHPNADKWTTARTLSLSGDASGSVSWDGSANATLSVTVANDSHSHSNYITSNAVDYASNYIVFEDGLRVGTGTGLGASGRATIAFGEGSPTADTFFIEYDGENLSGDANALIFRNVNSGESLRLEYGGAIKFTGTPTVSGSTMWHSGNHGSGSGLDADTLDGYHLSTTRNAANTVPVRNSSGYLDLGWINTTSGATNTLNKIYASSDNYIRYVTPATFRSQVTDGYYLGATAKAADSNLLDGIDSSAFLRSNANDSFSGLVTSTNTTVGMSFNGALSWAVSSSDAAHQRADARDDATNYSRLHWYGVSDGGSTNYFRHAWYDGSAYINIDANSSNINFARTTGTANLQVHGNTVWHAGNDGSGSGLDADLLDGYHASSASTASTIALRNGSGDIYQRYGHSQYMSMSHSTTTRSSDTVFYSSTDNYIRKNNSTGFRNSLGLGTGDSPTLAGLTLGAGVTLSESSDRADLLQISSNTSGWGGLQIRNSSNEGRWSFMTDGSAAGIYDDENGDWHVQWSENAGTTMYYNGASKINIGSTYTTFYQTLNLNNNQLSGVDTISHHNDTNTYMQFHADDQWRVVVGGSERLEVKNSSPHVLVSGDLNSTSDERLKDNVQPITNALSDVTQLEGVSFDWKDTGTRGHGFIAQQVEPILPDLVNTDEETGMKSVNYIGMIGHLVEAIKEQQEQIDALKKQLNG